VANAFLSPSDYPGANFVEIVNIIDNVDQFNTGGMKKRYVECDNDPLVYRIVKANEMYSNDGRADGYKKFLQSYQQTLVDIGSVDFVNAIPWISSETVVADMRPSGQVMVMGSNYDIQTSYENSQQLYTYFLNNSVNTALIKASNWNHDLATFENPVNPQCGQHIVHNFIQDLLYDSSCLSESIYATFETATYNVYNSTSPPPIIIATGLSLTDILLIVTSITATLIVVSFILSKNQSDQ
jgi:hypothetical protein